MLSALLATAISSSKKGCSGVVMIKRIPIGLMMFTLAVGGFMAYGFSLGYDLNSIIEWAKSFGRRAVLLGGDVTGTKDVSEVAATLIANFEGFSPHAYPDPAGQTQTYSIGYGHQIVEGDGYDLDTVLSESDAFAQLQSDIQKYRDCVEGAVEQSLSVNQEAACISLCYNIGCGAFRNSTVVRLLNAGDFAGASQAFSMWRKAGGAISATLVSRRQSEIDLFNS